MELKTFTSLFYGIHNSYLNQDNPLENIEHTFKQRDISLFIRRISGMRRLYTTVQIYKTRKRNFDMFTIFYEHNYTSYHTVINYTFIKVNQISFINSIGRQIPKCNPKSLYNLELFMQDLLIKVL